MQEPVTGAARDSPGKPHIVVCGGGVGAVEALLALRAIEGLQADVKVVTPSREFVFEPLAVAAPFGRASTRILDLDELSAACGATLTAARLASVDAPAGEIRLEGGARMGFDHLIVAVGARRERWLEGALHFGGDSDVEAYRELLARYTEGGDTSLVFAKPHGPSWGLPLYELALLTSAHLAEAGVAGVQLTLLTPRAEPLEGFGPAASHTLRDLLADRGIALKTRARARSYDRGRLVCEPGPVLEADGVVTLAQLAGPGVPGLSCDADGFIETLAGGRVSGLENVYAVGDGTVFPVKQGGVTAWQADVAVAEIARSLGLEPPEHPAEPALRAMLLTGIAPTYLRAPLTGGAGDVAAGALWWPPGKIAGRYLAPYIAGEAEAPFEDRASDAESVSVADLHAETRHLALTFADSAAMHGELDSALGWLEVVEHLEGELPAAYAHKREEWRAGTPGRAGGGAA